jgi:hypothetical protein
VIPIPPEILDRVIEDGVRHSGVDRERCRVLFARAVTWPDGSLGCPEPGRSYTQALTLGYWIVLEIQGKPFDYRVTRLGHIRLCTELSRTGPMPLDAI